MGVKLDLKNPKTFTEKIQWLKLNNRKPEYTTMVDKYAVKKYVADKIGDKYIIPTLGVWNTFGEIDFDSLPGQFVLKTTHGGGSSGVVICRDKSSFDIKEAKQKLDRSLKTNNYWTYREWPYKNVPRRIIAEKFLEIPDKTDLTDYKFYCFDGEPRYIQVIQDRNTKETIDFFDTEWQHQEFTGLNPVGLTPGVPNAETSIVCPDNLDDMLDIARKLSKGIPFVRVDLYQTVEGVYYGEITFYPASGLGCFTPDEWNGHLGDLIKIPKNGGNYLIYNNNCTIIKVDGQLKDFKFFCFNGEPKFLKVDFDRFTNHHANYYDMEWNLLPFGEADFPPDENHIEVCPPNFDAMVDIAKKLSTGHKFLRVDLYNIGGKIFFGELTFFPASGLGKFTTEKSDSLIGGFLVLN